MNLKNFGIFFLLMACGLSNLFAQSTRPSWVETPYSNHSKTSHLVAVGDDASRLGAENAAFANLVKVFGTTVELDARSTTRMSNDEMSSSAEQNVGVSAQHSIENMSIAEVWQNPSTKNWSALAILPKQQTAQIYAAKVTDLDNAVQDHLNNAEYEEDLLYKFSLIDMAAIYAQESANFAGYHNILSSVQIESKYEYRRIKAQANTVARGISFTVRTQNDNSLTQFAIEEMVAAFGMRMNDMNPMYILNEKLSYQGVDNGFGMYILNYVLNIELLDAVGNRITVFTFKGKEGGSDEANAVRVLQNSLARDISNGDSAWNTNSLLAQFTAFLDSSLK